MEDIYFSKISDDCLTIRELNPQDSDDVFELLGNENVCLYLGIYPLKNHEESLAFINKAISNYYNNDIFYLGIELKNKKKIIGYIGLSKYDLSENTCQVVYALNEKYWHQGIMPKALRLFVDYLIEIQKKELIIATHIDVNYNSGQVMKKAGFTRDYNYDQVMVIKGKNRKLIGYSIKKNKE